MSKKDEDLVREVAAKVDPAFTEAEVDLALRRVSEGRDPIAAAESVLDDRIALSSRAARTNGGDPYPALESLLSESEQKARAKRKIEDDFGDDGPPSPDLARERQALEAAMKENEELRRTVAEKDRRLADSEGASRSELEAMRQRVADMERENEEMRSRLSEGTPQAEVGDVPTGPGEQTGGLAASTKRTDQPKAGA